MSVFGDYARYYDLLYRDKDYTAEAAFVDQLIQKHLPGALNLLDLGCGTGAHAIALGQKGYRVHGIDVSNEMLQRAEERLGRISKEVPRVSFSQGDIRTARLDGTFDAVVSLFHVMSYQVTNEDLRAAFATARAHLRPGGLFIFDCWYGPAVLAVRPDVRVKRFEDQGIKITRIAEPVLHPNDNVVEVNYEVLVEDKATGVVEHLKETHRLRYLFKPEIEILFATNNLQPVACTGWMTDGSLSEETWYGCFVARG